MQMAIDAIYCNDFDKLRSVIISFESNKGGSLQIMMILVHYYYNNIPRSMLENYTNEEKHFKDMDITVRKLDKLRGYLKKAGVSKSKEFTYNLLLRGLNALNYCLKGDWDSHDKVYKLEGICDVLIKTKLKDRRLTKKNPFHDDILKLVWAIKVLVCQITKENEIETVTKSLNHIADWYEFWSVINQKTKSKELKYLLMVKDCLKDKNEKNPFQYGKSLCLKGSENSINFGKAASVIYENIEFWNYDSGTLTDWLNILECCQYQQFLTEWDKMGAYSTSIYFDEVINQIADEFCITMEEKECSCMEEKCKDCVLRTLLEILEIIHAHEKKEAVLELITRPSQIRVMSVLK